MANTASRRLPGLCIAISLLILAGPGATWAGDWKVTPRLSIEERYTDNVDLDPDDRARSDWITEITPAVSVSRDGRRLKVNADYRPQGLIYANESRNNDVLHNLNGRANAELLADWLYLDATARASQQQVDYGRGGGLGDGVGAGNTTQYAGYGLTPYLKHRFGSTGTLEMRYSREAVSSDDDTNGSDSSTNRYVLKATSGADFFPLSWSVSYDKADTDYQDRQDSDRESGLASLRLQIRRDFGLLAQAGLDKNNYTGASNRVRDYSYYGLGFFYNPGRRLSMDVIYNDSDDGGFFSGSVTLNPTLRTSIRASSTVRNFGRTQSLDLTHRTRHGNWSLRYSEQLTDYNEEYLSPAAYWQCADGSIGSGSAPPGCTQLSQSDLDALFGPQAFNTSLSDQNYVSKRLVGTWTYRLRRSDWRISLFNNEREYQTSGETDQSRGLQASWSLKPSARTTFTLSGGLSQQEDSDGDRDDDLWNARFIIRHKFLSKVTGDVELRHQERDASQPGDDYAENSLAARVKMTF
jgi:uncharacterized protein (PEP-CTERM system associated)